MWISLLNTVENYSSQSKIEIVILAATHPANETINVVMTFNLLHSSNARFPIKLAINCPITITMNGEKTSRQLRKVSIVDRT
jgi:hypothetical protein